MGITGLIPFLEKASRKANVSEFSGSTVAIDTYCWLHKGAFACADKLVRGEVTDIHIKYCLKYVSMLLSRNIKPILVFDGRHLPAKAMTEAKRRESRTISKKRAAELLSLGKIEEARSYMRRSVDITHAMALQLIKECRIRNVDCIVAPYEADAQLAYLNIKNIAHLVITEDSDLILFGCTKVLFKMDLDGSGTLVETSKLPLVMKCPIEHYSFDKFRQMCIMSGCDYLASLPGIGLAKARQFMTATQDPNIANALRKLPSYFNKSSLTVTEDYRENFLKAEATFKHQYVYDPIERKMVRLTEPEDEDIETALCVNAGELLDPKIAFQLALGNVDPFTLKKMDDWHPDKRGSNMDVKVKTESWKEQGIANHPTIWRSDFRQYTTDCCPWQKKPKKVEPIIAVPKTRARQKVVNLVAKYVPETQDESLSMETLSNMYCVEPQSKKQKMDVDTAEENMPETQDYHNMGIRYTQNAELPTSQNEKSPILENKERSFRKCIKNGNYSILKRLSKFPRTVLDGNVVESKFFNPTSSDVATSNNIDQDDKDTSKTSITIDESPEKPSRNPFRVKPNIETKMEVDLQCKPLEIDTECFEIPDTELNNSQKENSCSPVKVKQPSPIIDTRRNPFKMKVENSSPGLSEDSLIENTYPMEELVTPVDSQLSFGYTPPEAIPWSRQSQPLPSSQQIGTQKTNGYKKSTCKVPGLKRTASLPSNQPTLLSKFGFQKKPAMKKC